MSGNFNATSSQLPPSAFWSIAHSPMGEHGAQLSDSSGILIVEDDFLVSAQMEVALSEAGFEVVGTASTGEEALQLAEARRPVLVVMDIRLSGGRDGIDTALELFRLHRIRCVFASAHSDADARRRAASAAPVGWLQKPYMMETLAALVRSALIEVRRQPD